jgi:hypothetical protein
MNVGAIQYLSGLVIEVAEAVSLDPKGQNRKQQVPRQVKRRRSPEHAPPSGSQPAEIETAQMRDLVFYECH